MRMTSSDSLEAMEYPNRSPGALCLPADRVTVFTHTGGEEESEKERGGGVRSGRGKVRVSEGRGDR